MSTVMVIGSNSFSGSDFIDLLLEETDHRVIGISRSPQKGSLFLPYRLRVDLSRFTFHQIDLNHDMPRLRDLLASEQPAYIVNFAAQSEVAPSWQHPDHWFQTNAVALSQLISFLNGQDWLQRYVHISSPEVYGTCVGTVKEDAPLNPSTPYAASKAAADLLLATYVKNFDFPLATVRATNVYGPHQQLFKITPRSAIYIKLGRTIPLHGGGQAVKSFIHIRDVSRGELAVMRQGETGEIYHLSPDHGVAVRDLVATICQKLGKPFEDATEIVGERTGQDAAYIIDSTKARSQFGWQPRISLEQTIEQVIDWIERNWSEIQQQPLDYLHKP